MANSTPFGYEDEVSRKSIAHNMLEDMKRLEDKHRKNMVYHQLNKNTIIAASSQKTIGL